LRPVGGGEEKKGVRGRRPGADAARLKTVAPDGAGEEAAGSQNSEGGAEGNEENEYERMDKTLTNADLFGIQAR